MILIGVGSNVPGPWGTPEENVTRVRFELDRGPVRVERASSPVRTTPFGITDQPPFINAALAIETDSTRRASRADWICARTHSFLSAATNLSGAASKVFLSSSEQK